MEPISRELTQRLAALGLASAADLRRCARRVRNLARGLPATDMVWLDALVHAGNLTPFQARFLEEGRGHELVVGRKFVLKCPLQLDPLLTTYQASSPGKRETMMVSGISCVNHDADAAALRLLKTIKNVSSREPVPGFPIDAMLERGRLFLVAPYQPGDSLASMLVRRGRFPESIVRALLQDLLRQFQAIEALTVHGDLRPANLWLTRRGEVRLLNWGLLDAVVPEITIHSQLPLDAYDGLAPERVEGRKKASSVTDIYALGCLLWQLLTGRPPFTTADPLAKLTAHRQKQIPDVRTLAPDVSEALATLIKTLTNREAARRPQSFREVQQLFVPSSSWTKPQLQRFVGQFESAAPRQVNRERQRSRIPAMAATVLLTAGVTIAAWNREKIGWPGLPRLSASIVQTSESATGKIEQPEVTSPSVLADLPVNSGTESSIETSLKLSASMETGLADVSPGMTASPGELPPDVPTWLPFPGPNLDGVVTLGAGLDYVASPVMTGETLTIRSDARLPATIHVQDSPLVLAAENIRLENVRIVVDPQYPAGAGAPVQLQGSTLTLQKCVLDEGNVRTEAFMAWSALEDVPLLPGRMLAQDTRIQTSGSVLEMQIPLGAALFNNVATGGSATLLDLKQGSGAGLLAPVILNQCTLRSCGPVVSLPGGNRLQESGRVSLQGSDTLIDLRGGEPLLTFSSSPGGVEWTRHVEVAGTGLVVEVGIQLAASPRPQGGGYDALPVEELSIDGMLSADYHFEPVDEPPLREKVVIDALPVRVSDRAPGVDVSRLIR